MFHLIVSLVHLDTDILIDYLDQLSFHLDKDTYVDVLTYSFHVARLYKHGCTMHHHIQSVPSSIVCLSIFLDPAGFYLPPVLLSTDLFNIFHLLLRDGLMCSSTSFLQHLFTLYVHMCAHAGST